MRDEIVSPGSESIELYPHTRNLRVISWGAVVGAGVTLDVLGDCRYPLGTVTGWEKAVKTQVSGEGLTPIFILAQRIEQVLRTRIPT